MAVGVQLTAATVNADITNLSTSMRNLMQAVANLSVNINGQNSGTAVLTAAGFTAADAATALNAISYMNTVAGVYFGTASQPTNFSFNTALSGYWAGQ